MITLTHVSKPLRTLALKLFVVVLLLAGGSEQLRAQAVSKGLIAPQRSGDQLVLWGGFDRADRPVLEFTQLVRKQETPLPPAVYPPLGTDTIGRLILTNAQGKTVQGRWMRVKREWIMVPGGGDDLGEGWVAECPYLPGASTYRLYEEARDLGGESFPPPPQLKRPTAELKRVISKFPVEDDNESELPSDLLTIFAQPAEQWWWSLLIPGGRAPHGTWVRAAHGAMGESKPQVLHGTVIVAWPGLAKYPEAPRESSSFSAGWPNEDGALAITIVTREPDHYPTTKECWVRRSYGLQVIEERLEFRADAKPPFQKSWP